MFKRGNNYKNMPSEDTLRQHSIYLVIPQTIKAYTGGEVFREQRLKQVVILNWHMLGTKNF